jgi:hypothetical protein
MTAKNTIEKTYTEIVKEIRTELRTIRAELRKIDAAVRPVPGKDERFEDLLTGGKSADLEDLLAKAMARAIAGFSEEERKDFLSRIVMISADTTAGTPSKPVDLLRGESRVERIAFVPDCEQEPTPDPKASTIRSFKWPEEASAFAELLKPVQLPKYRPCQTPEECVKLFNKTFRDGENEIWHVQDYNVHPEGRVEFLAVRVISLRYPPQPPKLFTPEQLLALCPTAGVLVEEPAKPKATPEPKATPQSCLDCGHLHCWTDLSLTARSGELAAKKSYKCMAGVPVEAFRGNLSDGMNPCEPRTNFCPKFQTP